MTIHDITATRRGFLAGAGLVIGVAIAPRMLSAAAKGVPAGGAAELQPLNAFVKIGTDDTVTIPAVRITLGDGNALKAALATRSRTRSGVFANLGVNLAVRAGADAIGRALMYAPNPFQSGSSVSHYDVSAIPNQLMEPSINGDLTHEVTPPNDLTYPLLLDIGW